MPIHNILLKFPALLRPLTWNIPNLHILQIMFFIFKATGGHFLEQDKLSVIDRHTIHS